MSKDLRLRFRVTDEMVARFVELTGDRSSLHTNAEFARRSMYRAPVVHGMLPVLFVGALPLAEAGNCWRPALLACRFVRPVFCGEELELVASQPEGARDGAESEIEFRIVGERGAAITTGMLRIAPADVLQAAVGAEPHGTLLLDPPEEAEFSLADISKGDTARLEFTLSPGALAELEAILAAGGAVLPLPCDMRPLAAASLTSTLVGMCLPGKHATYTNLSLDFQAPLGPARHELKGTVRLVSRSTESIRMELSITALDGEPSLAATGKFTARVNRPPLRMPGMESISEAAADLGLRGRVALVTGASRGIGETTVKLLAALGARVVINYRSGRADAKRIEEEIRTHGGTALAVAADVSDEAEVERMFETIARDLGHVDVLVNNAVGSFYPIPFDELQWRDIQQELEVSLKGAFLCARTAARHMERGGGGVVINVSSIATEDPPPDQIRYVVAKSALIGLTRSLAVELGPRGIRVNAVVPGLVETDLSKHVPRMYRDSVAQKTPLRRLATPLDVAKAVALLASSYSEFTSGMQFAVTGGSPPFL